MRRNEYTVHDMTKTPRREHFAN